MSQWPFPSDNALDRHSSLSDCYLTPVLRDRYDSLQSLKPMLPRRDRSLSPPTKNTIRLPTLQDSLDHHLSTSYVMTQRSLTLSPLSDRCLDSHESDEDHRSICPGTPTQTEQVDSDMAFFPPLVGKMQNFRAINHDSNHPFDLATTGNIKRQEEIGWRDEHGEEDEDEDRSLDDQITSSVSSQDTPQDLEDLLEEAYRIYGDEKPEFCIGHPEGRTRTVKMANSDTTTILVFRTWLGGNSGYWLLTDDNEDRHIVKHMRGRYHVWQGRNRNFSRDPIAYASKGVNQEQHNSDIGDHRLVAKASPVRNLRNRTLKQERPYSIYNAQKRIEDKGDTATESQLELAVTQSTLAKQTPKRKAVPGAGLKKRKLDTLSAASMPRRSHSLLSESTMMLTTPSHHGSSNIQFADRAVLRTRLDTVDGPSIAVFLGGIQSCAELFEKLEAKWTFRLSNSQIRYCIAHFDWLDSDKSILMQENDEDGFHLLIDEIRRAPAWQRDEQVNVALELHAA